MNFISKLYFNVFKRIGNIRLLFVFSCIFAFLSLNIILDTHIEHNNVYYITVTKDTDLNWLGDNLVEYRISSYKGDFGLYKKEDIYKLEMFYLNRLCEKDKNIAFAIAEQWYANVGKGAEFSTPTKVCERIKSKTSEKITVSSLSGLWYLLWVVFWFYFPFLIVLPFKFVIDGYNQDKKYR